MALFFVRFFYAYLYLLVPIWYGLSLNLTRIRRYPPLPKFYSPREIAEELEWGSKWRPDPVRGLLDVVMDPRKMQARIDDGDSKFGDCDDHALYWATALLQSHLADRAWLGTVYYSEPGKRGTGHVVCVYQKGTHVWWTDYGLPTPVVAPWGWAYEVANVRGKALHAAGRVEVTLRANGAPRLRWFKGRSSTVHL